MIQPFFSSSYPGTDGSFLLMTCCAPCVCAVAESLVKAGLRPTLYFDNPNIIPEEEYFRRRDAVIVVAEQLNLPFVERDYAPDLWLAEIQGFESEPERGERCLRCFQFRLSRAAAFADSHGFSVLASVLGFSRWKSAAMNTQTLERAVSPFPNLFSWDPNWRKNGRQERTPELIRQWSLYQQDYCGCPFSHRK